jgi:integrase
MSHLKDGVMQRGSTWSFVIRVDPETGRSRPRWVGGFTTEKEAKSARDDARVKARRREYVDGSRITVAEYFGQWLDDHEVEVKPQTMASYRDLVTRYVVPRIGHMRLQGVQPAALTKLYRDLRDTGGVQGRGLSPRTVDYVHAVLRKAFNDAVRVDQILASNPAERAKRPRRVAAAPREVWTREQLLAFLESAESHRLYPFFHLAAYSGARRGELLNLRWADVDLADATIRIRGTTAVTAGKRVEARPKAEENAL